MADDPQSWRTTRTREDYERGLRGYHDPIAGTGGPAERSALTSRFWLAGFVLAGCTAGVVLTFPIQSLRWFFIVLVVLAVIALVDFVRMVHRKRRGEPG